jgi:pilus assembly protein CpaF
MAEPVINGSARAVPPIVRTARPVALKIQQEIKSAVHHGLIKRLDLEKIALMHENPASQQQLLTVIHQLIGEQNIPLSAAERDRLAQEVLDEVFVWARWNRCCRTRASTTSW